MRRSVGSALLVFDEGPGAGLGHRRRMESLALGLHDREWQCRLVPIEQAGRIAAPVVVVDSYAHRADEVVSDADLRVALDDLSRDLDVDLVIDPSPGADASRHRRARRVCAGAPYALVSAPRPRVAVVGPFAEVERVLVTTGSADAAGHGPAMAGALQRALANAEIRCVVGAWGASDVPEGVVPVVAPPSLADEMAAASVVVTAGGVAMLEACLLGRVVVAVVLADNQRVAVDALRAAGAVAVADPGTAADVVAMLVADSARRAALATAARGALDALGPARVADAIVRQAASSRTS